MQKVNKIQEVFVDSRKRKSEKINYGSIVGPIRPTVLSTLGANIANIVPY
jgi:hypothetical protein